MLRDLLCALRRLRLNPLFASAAIAILALGIGANTAVFSIVDAVLLRPSFASPETLVRIEENNVKRFNSTDIPAHDYQALSTRTDLFARTAAHMRDIVTITGTREPYQVNAQRVTAGLFPLLGVQARLGRTPSEEEMRLQNPVMLSDRLWRRLFDADPAAIGRSFTASGEVFTIAGVMPPEFEFPYSDIEMWLPLRPSSGPQYAQMIARTMPGLTLPQVQNALRIAAPQLEREFPRDPAGLKITATRWRDNIGENEESTLVFVLAAVGLVLLIACADVAGLLLSRAVKRQREIAIRASLGAGFWRVLRQLMTESLVLAVAGSAAGMAVAAAVLRVLTRQIAALPIAMPHLQRIGINSRVLLFNIAICLALASIVSIAPVLLAARADIQQVLRGGMAGGNPRGPSRLFSLVIACEAAFAFLLLAGSGLMVRSLIRLQQSDHGINPDHVLTMRVPTGTRTQPRPTGRDTRARQAAYYRDLLERLERVPGVAAVAVVNNPPLSTVNTAIFLRGPDHEPLGTSTRTVSAQYFTAMGIPLIAGRTFTADDDGTAPPVAIVNQSLARLLFSGRDPIGQSLPSVDDTRNPAKIIGVVRDTPQMSYERPPQGEVYIPYQQLIFGAFMSTIVVRTPGDPLSVAAALRREIWAVDPNQPIVRIATMNDVIAESIWRPRFSAWIFSILGGLALLLTSCGVYGVVSYTTTLRAREVGIRMALGATPADVIASVLRGVMFPLVIGLAVAFAAALALSRLLTGLLYQIGAVDPIAYIGAAVLLLAIGAVASARPAWKAATGDPLLALRAD